MSYFDDVDSNTTHSPKNHNSFPSSSRIWASNTTGTASNPGTPYKSTTAKNTDADDILNLPSINFIDYDALNDTEPSSSPSPSTLSSGFSRGLSFHSTGRNDNYGLTINNSDSLPSSSSLRNMASASTVQRQPSSLLAAANNAQMQYTSQSQYSSQSSLAKHNRSSYDERDSKLNYHRDPNSVSNVAPSQLSLPPKSALPGKPNSYHHGYNMGMQPPMQEMQQSSQHMMPSSSSHGQHSRTSEYEQDLSGQMQKMRMESNRHEPSMNMPPQQSSYNMPPQMPMDPLESLLGPFPCVRLRNLPYDANIEDVLLFFQGLIVTDIVLLPPPVYSGQHQVQTSEAFVLFSNPADWSMAFQRNRQPMRHGSCVEVFQGKRNDYYGAVSSQYVHFQKSSHYRQGDHGRRSESPYTSNSMPTQQPRGNVGTHPQMHQGPQGQPHMGRPRGSSRIDSRSKAAGRGRGGGIQVGEHTGYLRMRGLPFTTTKEEIFEFFKGYDPIEESVCLSYRSDGRATGEGYIAFPTPELSESAMGLHKKSLGSRYIELFISNKEEHGRAKSREPRDSPSTAESE